MDNRTICFCFGYTIEDIVKDVMASGGRSNILERILESRKAGSCRCRDAHPEGR